MQASIRFGNVEVRPAERQLLLGGEPVALGGRAFDLLLALIERRDRVVTKNELFELVWPGLVVEENNLQVQISALRKLLGAQAIATVAGRGYRFALPIDDDAPVADAPAAADQPTVDGPTQAVTYLFTDVEGSTRLWEEQPQAMQGAMARHEALCRELVARHGGRIVKLTGDGIHAFFAQASGAVAAAVDLQIALQELQSQALPLSVRMGMHRGLDMYRDGDFYGTAVNRAARVMSAAHGGQVLVSHAVAEAVGAALPAGVSLRDLGAVRLRDLSGPERLYQVIHERLRLEFPPLRSLEATPNNLPQQLNSFIGREREMAEVAELLAQHRLVTLLAMGGIGKSRLAVQLGAQLLDRFPDGVWLVELAALTDPHSVPQALATVLGLRDAPGTSLIDTLLNHLRERKLLILLDNCEHLVDACAEVAKTVLQRSTGVRILATSRDPLAIAGEMSVPLQPLSVPAAGEATVEGLLRHEAVHLFVERARAAQHVFMLDAGNAAAVAEICARLDGIPLALELAAARVRVMTPQMIASRLDQRFKLLVASDRTVLPRQKTLRALIDWSYDMLPEQEQRMFGRLSVFAGGWTLEAAEKVCNDEALHAEYVLDLICNLVQKSLVTVDPGTGRFGMLETVCAFAREKLEERAGQQVVRERHFTFYLQLAERARDQLFGAEPEVALRQLDAERENLLTSGAWADAVEFDIGKSLRLTSALRAYWTHRGLVSVGLRLAMDVLRRRGAGEQGLASARALFDAGDLTMKAGRLIEARDYFLRCLKLVRDAGDSARQSMVLRSLSIVAAGLREERAARIFAEESVTTARAAAQPPVLAAALVAMSQVARTGGEHTEARRLCREARRIFLRTEDRTAVITVRLNEAMLMIDSGRLRSAAILLLHTFQAASELGSVSLRLSCIEAAAALAAEAGDAAQARRLFGKARAERVRAGQQREHAEQVFLSRYSAFQRSAADAEDEPAEPHVLVDWLVEFSVARCGAVRLMSRS